MIRWIFFIKKKIGLEGGEGEMTIYDPSLGMVSLCDLRFADCNENSQFDPTIKIACRVENAHNK